MKFQTQATQGNGFIRMQRRFLNMRGILILVFTLFCNFKYLLFFLILINQFGSQCTFGHIPRESAWEALNELGKLQCVHFDKNLLQYENPYVNSLRRYQDLSAKLKEIKKIIDEFQPELKIKKKQKYQTLLKHFEQASKERGGTNNSYANKIQQQITELYSFFIGQKGQLEKTKAEIAVSIHQFALLMAIENSAEFKRLYTQLKSQNICEIKCFLCNRSELLRIEKMIFRISRGNSILKDFNVPIEIIQKNLKTECPELNSKVVCLVIHEGSSTKVLSKKIDKLLSLTEDITILKSSVDEWKNEAAYMKKSIREVRSIDAIAKSQIKTHLAQLLSKKDDLQCSNFVYYEAYVNKQLMIYKQLSSTAHYTSNFLTFNVYIPKFNLPLSSANKKQNNFILNPLAHEGKPPTKFDSSPMLQIPQEIVNTYGVPTYGQFNPAPLYIVTFGFFIGVMFGDVGHMLMAIPFLIAFNVGGFGWITVFFMGFCGLLYNQFFGLNIGIFQSCYFIPEPEEGSQSVHALLSNDCVYPFGVDSIWKPALNQMQFTNSMKMKISVILGVAHMMLGLTIKVINCIKRSKWAQLFTLAIPQMLFMICTFVYMDFLIIFKWNTAYFGPETKFAPSIISTMIGIYANFGHSLDPFLWNSERQIQQILLIVSFVMIPIMLLGVPILTCIRRRGSNNYKAEDQNSNENFNLHHQEGHLEQGEHNHKISSINSLGHPLGHSVVNEEGNYHKEEQEPIRQILVHQFIETIQYVLGTVSNTASYLRLWALSLAHGQLSEVIFNLLLQGSVTGGYSSIIGIIFLFPFFYAVTFGILLCMDTMQCFLHSLRLHWVQFQNKFYEGKGYLFQGFSFKQILKEEE